jgi:hypothetical protein
VHGGWDHATCSMSTPDTRGAGLAPDTRRCTASAFRIWHRVPPKAVPVVVSLSFSSARPCRPPPDRAGSEEPSAGIRAVPDDTPLFVGGPVGCRISLKLDLAGSEEPSPPRRATPCLPGLPSRVVFPAATLGCGSEEPRRPALAGQLAPRLLGRNPSPPAPEAACAAPNLGPVTASRPEDRSTLAWQRIPDRKPSPATSRAIRRSPSPASVGPACGIRRCPSPARTDAPRRERPVAPIRQPASDRGPPSAPPALRRARSAPVDRPHLDGTLASFGATTPLKRHCGPEIGRSARRERAVPRRKPHGPKAIPLPTGAINRRWLPQDPRRGLASPVAIDAPTLTRAPSVCRTRARKQEKSAPSRNKVVHKSPNSHKSTNMFPTGLSTVGGFPNCARGFDRRGCDPTSPGNIKRRQGRLVTGVTSINELVNHVSSETIREAYVILVTLKQFELRLL